MADGGQTERAEYHNCRNWIVAYEIEEERGEKRETDGQTCRERQTDMQANRDTQSESERDRERVREREMERRRERKRV